ncbi:MAG: OmpA family protein [Balneolaceae bacterium]
MKETPINKNSNSLYPKKPFEDLDDESWQVSYLDIITIILGFLIILLSVSQIAKPEFTSLSTVFGNSSDKTEFLTTPIEEIQEELERLLQPQIEQGRLIIYKDLNDIRIRFKGDDFYTSGSASIQGEGLDLLNHVIRAFQQTSYSDFNIEVEGHTDNVPISTANYDSNWELSTARASNVVKYFDRMGLEEDRLKASGFADSRPLVQFDSFGNPFAASKEQNRRIVLRLFYTSEGLQKRANDEALAANDESLPEVDITSPEPESQADQIAKEVLSIATANKNKEKVEVPEPIKEEIVPPTPTPEPVTEPIASNELPNIPSFLDENITCSYSVQVGSFQSLAAGFQVANNAETKTGLNFEVASNNQLYSVRSTSVSSFTEALNSYTKTSEELDESSVGLIHQCYQGGQKVPTTLEYQIQFGAFQNQENALNYTIELEQEFQIQTYMNRLSNTYNIVAGPYDSRERVIEQLNSFKAKGITENIFIKPVNESMLDYKYAYQLQLDSFSSINEAQTVSNRISETLGISSTILRSKDGAYLLLTERSMDWNETISKYQRLKNRVPSSNPVIYFLEYI